MTRGRTQSGICVALIASFTIGAAAGAETVTKAVVVVAGGVLQLAHFASVNPDCTSKRKTVVRVTDGPAHGTILVKETKAFSTFRNYQQCNVRRVDGVAVEYLPQRGYLGADTVGLDVFYPSGEERMRVYDISVK
jgi:hypothetical protein